MKSITDFVKAHRNHKKSEDDKKKEKMRQIEERYGKMHVPISFNVKNLVGHRVAVREDEISTGGTSVGVAFALRKIGVTKIDFFVTHPVCTGDWKGVLFPENGNQHPFNKVYFGNTRNRKYEEGTGGLIKTVNMNPVIGNALTDAIKDIG